MKAYEETTRLTPEQFETIKTGHFHVTEEKKPTKMKRVKVGRTHHAFLHPTKGWRKFARPRKTNRRRKLIPMGRFLVMPIQ